MDGVNVLVQRQIVNQGVPDAYYDSSSVSGFLFQRSGGNAVTGASAGMAASMGTPGGQWQGNFGEGYYDLGWIPMINAGQPWVNVLISTELVNPLYTGTHAVGPYRTGQVKPSGSAMSSFTQGLCPNDPGWCAIEINFTATDAAKAPNPTADGTEAAPQPVAAGGWWTGLLSGRGHTSWASFAAKAGRTATVEVTALDESGLATTAKAMPLIGVWGATDATGTLPTVAYTPSAFNTVTLGTTAVGVASAQAGAFRMAIADARGDGRPDFAYKARMLYADAIEPAATSYEGGQITISGMGFRAGNEVLVNGVSAAVSNWTESTIVAVAPTESAFAARPSGAVDVEVVDVSTGGTTLMSGVLTYSGVAPDGMTLVSAPSGTVMVGTVAATAFAVRVFLGDGVTPVVGLPVTFTLSGAAAQFGACAAATCVVLTDATGKAATTVTPMAFGEVSLQASAVGASETATFNAVAESVTTVRTVEYVAADAAVTWTPQVNVIQNGAAAAGVTVNWTSSSGMTFSPGSSQATGLGVAQTAATVESLAAGAQAMGQVCAWTLTPATTMCTSFSAVGVAPANWRLMAVSGAGQAIALAGTFAPVVVIVTDVAGDPVAGAPVAIYQTVNAAEMACPAHGACPIAPVLGARVSAGVSDADGMVSVTPMQIAGVGEVTNIAVAAGTQGFASLSIAQGP
jgi:hypothetical protein